MDCNFKLNLLMRYKIFNARKNMSNRNSVSNQTFSSWIKNTKKLEICQLRKNQNRNYIISFNKVKLKIIKILNIIDNTKIKLQNAKIKIKTF